MSKFFSALEEVERQLAHGESGMRPAAASAGAGTPVDTRQRVTRWLEEGQQVLAVLRVLLSENERLRGQVQVAEHECQALRDALEEATGALRQLVSDTLAPVVTRLETVRGRRPPSSSATAAPGAEPAVAPADPVGPLAPASPDPA